MFVEGSAGMASLQSPFGQPAAGDLRFTPVLACYSKSKEEELGLTAALPPKNLNSMSFYSLELCAGGGGQALGLERGSYNK